MNSKHYAIIKNVRDCEKDTRNGRTRVFMLTTYDIVDTRFCSLISEHRTLREAKARLALLQQKA